MNEVGASNSIFSDFAVSNLQKKEEQSNELGQSAFLELMIAQLENQDPLSPQENTEFIAQLAQFSSVESLDKLNNNFNTFSNSFVANQALQASTLVGRSVTVPAEKAQLTAGGFIGSSIDVPTSVSSVKVNIYSDNGTLVDTVQTGFRTAGEMVFRWDGLNAEVDGELLDWSSSHQDGVDPGEYSFEVTAQIDGKETVLDTALSANVNSVTIGADGTLTLNLAGIGAVSLADIKQFN